MRRQRELELEAPKALRSWKLEAPKAPEVGSYELELAIRSSRRGTLTRTMAIKDPDGGTLQTVAALHSGLGLGSDDEYDHTPTFVYDELRVVEFQYRGALHSHADLVFKDSSQNSADEL